MSEYMRSMKGLVDAVDHVGKDFISITDMSTDQLYSLFELGKKYTEAETREMLAAVYEDYSMLRRYLVDYGFMGRTKDGTEYWLK